jgi:hypothetical protein
MGLSAAASTGCAVLVERWTLTISQKRWLYVLWLAFIGCFALLHALHLTADFPNHTPWSRDWAKYTDEGWYGNAAIRAHLFGNWYLPGDLNPAPALARVAIPGVGAVFSLPVSVSRQRAGWPSPSSF